MKISSKLLGLSLGTVVVVAGLSATLVGELQSLSAGYNDLLNGPVNQAELARMTQVDFKKQVQEWKDILLRGQNAVDLAAYTSQFHSQEAKVKSESKVLADSVQDPTTRQLLNQFLIADDKLSRNYQAAYDVYVKSNFDFKAADKLVRGQDRPPTDLFDKVVLNLNAQVASQAIAQQERAIQQRNLALTVSGVLLGLICLAGVIIVRGVLTRLRQLRAVSDRLARADIKGLSIDISGKDEIGDFGQSLQGVAAAFRELLGTASL